MDLRKKWLFIFVSVLLLVAMAGCGGKSATNGKTTVDIFQFKVEFKNQFKQLADKYMKEHPNVQINITTVGGGSDYGAALKSKFASGNEPAIYNIGGPQDVKDWTGKLADLKDTKAAQAALPGTLKGVTKGSEVFGLPYNQEGYGLLYNKKVLKKAGIDPASIHTFADLTNAAKLLDQQKTSLGLKAVFAYAGKETWVSGLHSSNIFLSPEFDQDVTKAYQSKTVSFKYGKQLKAYLDLQQKYSVKPTASLDYSQQVEELFSNGKVAMIQQGNWVSPTIVGINADFAKNGIGILPIPVDGFKTDSIPVGVPMYWAVNAHKDTKTIKAAKDFLDWMYTSSEGKKIVINDFQFIPAYKGYDVSGLKDPISRSIYQYSKENKTIGWVFNGYPTGWGLNTLGSDIQQYMSGKLSWNNLLKDVEQKWKDARSQ